MKELAKKKSQFIREEVSKEDAIAFFTEKGDEYKLDLLKDLADGTITFYKQGNFTDLCRGPHIPDTERIKAIKLLNVAGAYWKGNEKIKQLTRIYAITFPKQTELDDYLKLLEEAKTIADQLLEDYPEASHLHLKRWLNHANERVKV